MDQTLQSRSDPSEITILIVDDEDYVADLLATVLQLEGFHTQVAYNGRTALSVARQYSIDLLVVDVMMPVIDGIELATQVRLLYPQRLIPVIFISAGILPAHSLATSWFVTKSFDIDHILTIVHQILS